MPKGRYGQRFTFGTRQGNFIVYERAEEIYRYPKSNYEYKYRGRCVYCGYVATKRLSHFRESPSHNYCPWLKNRDVPIAYKQYPGTFSHVQNELTV